MVSMETSIWKKLGKIGILSKENAPNWFCQMESHLCGERLWKVIQDVIKEQNTALIAPAAAAATAETPESESST